MASSGRASAYKSMQLDLWQIRWSSVFVVAIALALGSMPSWGWLPGPDRTQPPARGTVPPPAFSIPFQLIKGYEIVVTGTLGPLGQMRLAVDTGTHPTVIHRRVAQALGLRGKMVALKLFNQTLPVEEAVLPELTLGPIHKRNLPVVISDLDTVEREINGRVDAIIGFAVLGERSYTIDYDKQEIVFGPWTAEAACHLPVDRRLSPCRRGSGINRCRCWWIPAQAGWCFSLAAWRASSTPCPRR